MVFTGIVEDMGRLTMVAPLQAGIDNADGSKEGVWRLEIESAVAMEGAYIGCSICVNGTCLTAVRLDEKRNRFEVHVAPETIHRTNLRPSLLQEGDLLNIERAAGVGARNSGHNVQGHVDDVGKVVTMEPHSGSEALWVDIEAPAGVLQYVVEKGYIAIDGASLTVCKVDKEKRMFSVMLIPHTQQSISLPSKLGKLVNLEVDIAAKYSCVGGGLEVRLESLERKVNVLGAVLVLIVGWKAVQWVKKR